MLATSDVPGGVVNLLTGLAAELGPRLAGHLDVNAIDLAGVDDADLAADLEPSTPPRTSSGCVGAARRRVDWHAVPDPRRILAFTETKTVWHPIGI